MPLVPFGAYTPDVTDYEGQSTRNILNVVPQGDGYGPFKSSVSISGALPGTCRGAFYALKTAGNVAIFAATSDKLFLLDNTTYNWNDVSKTGGYVALNPNAQWQFVQFNNLVVAVQANAPPQVFDVTSSTEFQDLDGSPPYAAYASVVGRFIVLSGLPDTPTRIQWSGLNSINAADSWTPGVNSSDYQDLPDGGGVRGVAGGEFGTIFQEQAIRRMVYLPGSPLVFQIERVAQDHGLYAPYSVVRAGETILFHSTKGFYRIDPGGLPVQIGKERVDRTLLGNIDKSMLRLFMGASDPRSTRVFWAFKSVNGNINRYDTLLGYDKALDRFFRLAADGEYLLGAAQSGITLEGLDALYSSLDAIPGSLDDFVGADTPEISQVNGEHKIAFFRGPNSEATLETAEQGTDGRRLRVRGFRPVTDAATLYGSVSSRETQQAAAVAGQETPINTRTGRCDMNVSTRYSRFKCRIPAGENWTFCAGVEPDVKTDGLV